MSSGWERPLELHWDDDDEVWVAHVSAGGAAGTCLFSAIGIRLEFDRLDAGRITRLSVSPGLDPEVRLLVNELLGFVPDEPGESTGATSTAMVDWGVARALWDVTDLLNDSRAAAEGAGSAAAVFTIELAAAAIRAGGLFSSEFHADVPTLADVARAMRRLELLVQDRTPVALLSGLSGLLRQLGDAEALPRTEEAAQARESLSDRIAALLGSPAEPEYSGNVSTSIVLHDDVLEVAAPRGLDPSASFILRAWRGRDLVAVGQCNTGLTKVPIVLANGVPIRPDRVSREAPARAASVRHAQEAGAEARRGEGRADPEGAALWERAAAWWVDARSPARAASALRRAATLTNDPTHRDRLRQLATSVDPETPTGSDFPERLWLWWSHWEWQEHHSGPYAPADRDRGIDEQNVGERVSSGLGAASGSGYRWPHRAKNASGRLCPREAATV